MSPDATDAAPRRRIPAVRRGLWWAADYVYAARRQLAVLALPWSIGRPRPVPPRWRSADESLPEVVLLPGVYEHWTFLRPLGDALAAAGFRVSVVHGLGMNRRSIAATAERLRAELADLPAAPTGRVLVAHSKGGLIGKHLLVSEQAAAEAGAPSALGLRGLVAVATPFGGARRAVLLFADPSIRAFLPGDATIVELGLAAHVNARIVSIYGPYDPHITEGSALVGATNVEVPMGGHFRVLQPASTHRAVVDGIRHLTAG
ncbi:hypothetical protein JOD63_000168 [Microbacterium terrae]|uniref:Alpha/beta hydrolase family protein n=1 Tax=Microbacterium terrae TaxID=69369 RepID=A0A0M2H4J7_9MICO|nr:alpha/beta hydrolase [Microbacterium terrae]KJL38781.1 hypothetical protein RS81_02576 [Microbacterium terrae]MBP1076200.1 hypothetical protein [Microbacterium terrae]GLJ97021.1 hypothetical protein GCM10017594_02180 [Microbacterium terrae]